MRWEEAVKIKQNWTPEQARNDLERLIITGERPADKVVGLACQALDKQIPKKAIDDGTQVAICPECGASVNKDIEQVYNGETSYCICCGQALDWSETE